MSWGIVASVGATLVGSYMTADAAGNAADTQAASSEAGIQEERRQFDKVQELLKPYVTAGETALAGLSPFAKAGAPALEQQQALIGLKGAEAERAAIQRISGGETFKALARQGENAMLQNASATGGLRGGNIQAALAQFRPQLLSSLIDQQYGRLGGMTVLGAETTGNLASLGQASAAGTGAAAQTTGTNIATLLGQQGQARAGAELAQGKAYAAIPGAIAGGIGEYIGRGGTF
jgi:hypothetical protein